MSREADTIEKYRCLFCGLISQTACIESRITLHWCPDYRSEAAWSRDERYHLLEVLPEKEWREGLLGKVQNSQCMRLEKRVCVFGKLSSGNQATGTVAGEGGDEAERWDGPTEHFILAPKSLTSGAKTH